MKVSVLSSGSKGNCCYIKDDSTQILIDLGTTSLYIEKNLNGWNKDRLSRTAISILRLAVFEMMFVDDIPLNVSINEAVELAKKYSTKQESAYINGVLASISKSI